MEGVCERSDFRLTLLKRVLPQSATLTAPSRKEPLTPSPAEEGKQKRHLRYYIAIHSSSAERELGDKSVISHKVEEVFRKVLGKGCGE